jgi:hypothetical protein
MYLHIGNGNSVKRKNIIGIFDLDTATVSKITKDFINKRQKEGALTYLDSDLPRAFLLLDEEGRAIPPKELPIEEIIYNRSFKSPNLLPANSKCVFFGHTSSMAVFPDASIIVYKRDGSQGADIRDYIKVHLDTGAFVSGILGCFSIEECKCYFVKRGEDGLAGEGLALLKNV